MNADPAAAISEARKLEASTNDWALLRASVLCDAGIACHDLGAVEEASVIFTRLNELNGDDGGVTYNLANALVAQANLDQPSGPDWYLRTARLRRRARALFGEAAKILGTAHPQLASRALTNLGNSLDAAHRWVEAYECYQQALSLFPRNGVAAGCAARALYRVASLGALGHSQHLVDVAQRLAHHAKVNRDVVLEFAGPSAAATPEASGQPATVRLPNTTV